MSNRFVILHHTGHGPEHWDLMLEDGAVLKTWQLETSPLELKPGDSIPAKPLPDHRLAYLEYEGPVSQNRGEVSRVEAGEYSCFDCNEGEARFELLGETSISPLLLLQTPEGWRLSRQA